MSDSVQPHRRQPTRLLCPWDSPGKNTGVGCHFLLQCIKVKSESEVIQSCLTLSNPMDWSLPATLSMGFSRQEYWSRVPLPSPDKDLEKATNPTYHSLSSPEILQIKEPNFMSVERRGGRDENTIEKGLRI